MSDTNKPPILNAVEQNIVQQRAQRFRAEAAEFVTNDLYEVCPSSAAASAVIKPNRSTAIGARPKIPVNAVKLPAFDDAGGQHKLVRRCSSPAKQRSDKNSTSSVAQTAKLFEAGSTAGGPDARRPLSDGKPPPNTNKLATNRNGAVDNYAVIHKDQKKIEQPVTIRRDKTVRPKILSEKPSLPAATKTTGDAGNGRSDFLAKNEATAKETRASLMAPRSSRSPRTPPLPTAPPPPLTPRRLKTPTDTPPAGSAPKKPQRTFAHDIYLKTKVARPAVSTNEYEDIGTASGGVGTTTEGGEEEHLYEVIRGERGTTEDGTRKSSSGGRKRLGGVSRPANRPPPRPPGHPGRPPTKRGVVNNPGYGRVQRASDVIPAMRRSKSDECLYAELRHMTSGAEVAAYRQPADRLPTSQSGDMTTSHVTHHGVAIDQYGYAVPDVSLCRRMTLKNKKQMYEGRSANREPPYRRRPATTDNSEVSSQMGIRERVSRAYSILRPSMNEEGTSDSDTSDDDEKDPEISLERQRKHVAHVTKVWKIYAQLPSSTGSLSPRQLFSFALIVRLERVAGGELYKPTAYFSFPPQSNELEKISEFCFPTESLRRPKSAMKHETFSFVLTAADGTRHYGYCRRILPPGSGGEERLPEVICVVSSLGGAWGLYGRLLAAAERKRSTSLDHVQELLEAAYGRPLPAPGREAWVRVTVEGQTKETVILKRSEESRHENISFGPLLSLLSIETIVSVFSSMLLERRIIFMASNLCNLTACVDALVGLLYPLSWPHTLIPILPSSLLEVCCCPTPFIVGVLSDQQTALMRLPMEEVLIIDLDKNMMVKSFGDELTIIPRKLRKALTQALKEDVPEISSGAFTSCGKLGHETMTTKNSIVVEAFLRLFVETIGHYSEYLCIQQDGEKVFQRDLFVKAVSSKSIRLFLEWFSQTQMFNIYVADQLSEPPTTAFLFEARVLEYRDEMEAVQSSLSSNVKAVGRRMIMFIMNSGGRIKKGIRGNAFV